MKYGKYDGILIPRFGYRRLEFNLFLSFSLWFLLACSDEASCHVVSYPMERSTWQRTGGDLQPTASEKLRPSFQHPVRNWILPTPTGVNLEIDPSPSWALRWLQPQSTASLKSYERRLLLFAEILDPHKLWDNKCCFNPVRFCMYIFLMQQQITIETDI